MAITVLNEWQYFDPSFTSDLVSVFSKLNLYYRATKTNVIYSTVKVENTVTSNSVTFRTIELDEDATYKYYTLDGEQFFKYWYYNQGGVDMPEFKPVFDGEFVNTDFSQPIRFTISTYKVGDILLEDSTKNYYIAPLGTKMPSKFGFNLGEFYSIRNLGPLKLSNNTFNQVPIYGSSTFGGSMEINNLTTGKQLFNGVNPGSIVGTKALYFEKRIQNIWTSTNLSVYKPLDATGVRTYNLGTYNYGEVERVIIDFDKTIYSDDGSTNNRDELIFTYTSIPTETYTSTQQKDNNKNHITFNEKPTNAGSGTVNITLKIDNADVFSSTHVYFEKMKAVAEFTPAYSDYILAKGLNKIHVYHGTGDYNRVFEVDYDPYGCYVNLLFSHPQFGYVSYPFEGMKIESSSDIAGNELDIFYTTMINVNKISELTGIESNSKITISSQVNKKYWDILKEVYNSRHVYLYVGENGGLDSEVNWIDVRVSGSFNLNENKSKTSALFTINLELPTKFNNRL